MSKYYFEYHDESKCDIRHKMNNKIGYRMSKCDIWPIFEGENRITNVKMRVTGRFAPKPVPPGTIRSKTIFRTGRFTPRRFAPFVKNEIKGFLRNENRF